MPACLPLSFSAPRFLLDYSDDVASGEARVRTSTMIAHTHHTQCSSSTFTQRNPGASGLVLTFGIRCSGLRRPLHGAKDDAGMLKIRLRPAGVLVAKSTTSPSSLSVNALLTTAALFWRWRAGESDQRAERLDPGGGSDRDDLTRVTSYSRSGGAEERGSAIARGRRNHNKINVWVLLLAASLKGSGLDWERAQVT